MLRVVSHHFVIIKASYKKLRQSVVIILISQTLSDRLISYDWGEHCNFTESQPCKSSHYGPQTTTTMPAHQQHQAEENFFPKIQFPRHPANFEFDWEDGRLCGPSPAQTGTFLIHFVPVGGSDSRDVLTRIIVFTKLMCFNCRNIIPTAGPPWAGPDGMMDSGELYNCFLFNWQGRPALVIIPAFPPTNSCFLPQQNKTVKNNQNSSSQWVCRVICNILSRCWGHYIVWDNEKGRGSGGWSWSVTWYLLSPRPWCIYIRLGNYYSLRTAADWKINNKHITNNYNALRDKMDH